MAKDSETPPAALPPQESDLGFGSVVARESRRRLLNRDGSFNVRREGLHLWERIPLYHHLLTIRWSAFIALLTAAYLATNALFALLYFACGPGALSGFRSMDPASRLEDCFFFSVHTLATIGYGSLVPANRAANLVMTLESLIGLLAIALATGIVFARFSRPTAAIHFSRNALIAPYRGGSAFMFRIANRRSNQLVEMQAIVLFSRIGASGEREFLPLELERRRVAFFPLTWTIVHPIIPTSPLFGATSAELREADAEFLILLSGVDETFSQTVHARSSYKPDEVIFGARFRQVFKPLRADGILRVDVRALDDYEETPLAEV